MSSKRAGPPISYDAYDLEVVVGMLFGETKVRHRDDKVMGLGDPWPVADKALIGTTWTLVNRWRYWTWSPWDKVEHVRDFVLFQHNQYKGYWGPPEMTKENRAKLIARDKGRWFEELEARCYSTARGVLGGSISNPIGPRVFFKDDKAGTDEWERMYGCEFREGSDFTGYVSFEEAGKMPCN